MGKEGQICFLWWVFFCLFCFSIKKGRVAWERLSVVENTEVLEASRDTWGMKRKCWGPLYSPWAFVSEQPLHWPGSLRWRWECPPRDCPSLLLCWHPGHRWDPGTKQNQTSAAGATRRGQCSGYGRNWLLWFVEQGENGFDTHVSSPRAQAHIQHPTANTNNAAWLVRNAAKMNNFSERSWLYEGVENNSLTLVISTVLGPISAPTNKETNN